MSEELITETVKARFSDILPGLVVDAREAAREVAGSVARDVASDIAVSVAREAAGEAALQELRSDPDKYRGERGFVGQTGEPGRDGTEGPPGPAGIPGEPGKNAPWWPVVIATGVAFLVALCLLFWVRSWRPVDIIQANTQIQQTIRQATSEAKKELATAEADSLLEQAATGEVVKEAAQEQEEGQKKPAGEVVQQPPQPPEQPEQKPEGRVVEEKTEQPAGKRSFLDEVGSYK